MPSCTICGKHLKKDCTDSFCRSCTYQTTPEPLAPLRKQLENHW